MLVTIIGSGNVATVMGRVLAEKGYSVNKVYSRIYRHAAELAAELHAEAITDLSLLGDDAAIYLLAVSDDALAEVASKISVKNKLVIHTAGSVSKEILQTASTNYGVLWPMKMIRKSMHSLEPVTMVADGCTEPVTREIEQLAKLFSPVVTRADDKLRLQMHMLASLTSNFTNHLYHLAADYCKEENIDFALFYPIIEETAHRVSSQYPGELQAGPAFRGDILTIQKHLELLGKYPQAKKLYTSLTESIRKSFPSTPKADDRANL